MGTDFKNGSTAIADLIGGAEGIAIAEFAVILPILLVLAMGIVDFGAAFNVKQKLNNIAREGARLGANMSADDLSQTGTPPSVTAMRDTIDTSLVSQGISDCGLGTSGTSGPSLVWTFTGSTCSGGTFTLTIDRGNGSFPSTVGSDTINVISTQVTISYPYQWRFNRVMGLVAPGANYSGSSQITISALVPNAN